MRTALITGANRGIGFAIAQALARAPDMRVLAAARLEADAMEAAERIGSDTRGVVLDLSDADAAYARAEVIAREFGAIDVLINNAAVLLPGDAMSVTLGDMAQSLTVNTLAPFALIQVFGRAMKERGWGRIVNVSSGWGSFAEGLSGPSAYSVSKAALNAVTVSAAQALGVRVKVNAVCPGWVRTRMGGQGADRSPEQGADTAVWLATLPDDGPTGGFFRDRHLIDW
ncbi:MAG: SDR family NAD(P)-dependent oxidoreductase [Myxococcota bacterium]